MTPNPWLNRARPLSIAHRGRSLEVPENTLEAYRRGHRARDRHDRVRREPRPVTASS